MAWRSDDDSARAIGTLLGFCLIIVLLVWAVRHDRHERALVAGGHCLKITEALYTPPPSARRSCFGNEASQTCTTRYHQPDPYMRSLWRCADPDNGNKPTEFWRRSAEEFSR